MNPRLSQHKVPILIALLLLGLTALSWVLNLILSNGTVVLVILFQPELRRMIERVGSSLSSGKSTSNSALENSIAQTVLACT